MAPLIATPIGVALNDVYRTRWPFLLILIVSRPGVVVVNCWDRFCTLGRAPRTKETLSIFVSSVGLSDIHEYSAG